MQMSNFDFMKFGGRDPTQTTDGVMRNLHQAENHCRSLYEGCGRVMGAQSVRVRENGGTAVIFSWPAGGMG